MRERGFKDGIEVFSLSSWEDRRMELSLTRYGRGLGWR